MNDDLHIRLRKTENSLTVGGVVVILFGIWTLLRTLLFFLMDNLQKRILMQSTDIFLQKPVVMYIAIGGLALFEFMLRWYIGRRAIQEGRYGKEKKFYLVWVILMIACGVLVEAANMDQTATLNRVDWEDAVVAAIVDGTSLIILLQVFISSNEVKKLRRKAGQERGE